MRILLPPGRTARQWQTEAAGVIVPAWRRGIHAQCICSATGTGKGTLLAGLAGGLAEAGRSVLVLVHRLTLVDDLVGRVGELGITPGVLQGRRTPGDARLVVACVASVRGKRLAELPPYDVIIVDECHHAGAKAYQDILTHNTKARKKAGKRPEYLHLGFTATDYTADGRGGVRGLSDIYTTVYRYTVAAAIAAGDLVAPTAIKVETGVDLSSVERRGRDYDPEQLAKIINTDARNQLVVEKYREHGDGRPALAFCVDIQHAEDLAAAFRAHGYPTVQALHSNLPKAEQLIRIAAYESGASPVLVSCDQIREGFDSPHTEVILRVRPSLSMVVIVQMLGRGLRLHPGKSGCLVLDFIDRGLPLQLSVEADMVAEAERRREGALPELQPGDPVRHRYGDVSGVGTVQWVDEGLCGVQWPDDERTHGLAELVPVPLDDPERPAPVFEVQGLGEYVLELLPGQTPDTALGWYTRDGVSVIAGRGADGCTYVAHVRQKTDRHWVLWLCRFEGRRNGTAQKLGQDRDRRTVLRLAEAAFRRAGAQRNVQAKWREAAAADGTVKALRYAGLENPRGMTEGEARDILAIHRAGKLIRQTRGSLSREAGRAKYRQHRRQK